MTKLSNAQKEKLYDSMFTILDYMFKLYNPCEFKKLKKPLIAKGVTYRDNVKGFRCFNKGTKKTHFKKILTHNCIDARTYKNARCSEVSCCTIYCRHLTIKGCRVKSLGCKLFMCNTIRKKYPQLVKLRNMLTDVLYNQFNMVANCHYSKARSLITLQNRWK